MTRRKQDDPNQRLVPGFGLWMKQCRRDADKLQAERRPKPLPLFDRPAPAPQEDTCAS